MTEETKLLRAAINASIKADRLDPRGEYFADGETYTVHAEARDAEERAWKDYDLHIWVARYAP